MPTESHEIKTPDGVGLHVEVTGTGTPILFIHEFAGDHRSWEPQVRALSRRHRCITFSARGYPPSDVPTDPSAYSQDHAVSDALSVLDALEVPRAHIIGLSMGGFCALHLTMGYPDRVISTAIGGVGYGAGSEDIRWKFQAECEVIARAFEEEGAATVAARYAIGPARVQLQNKDPRGHAEFASMLAEHSDVGSALTMRGVQKERPSIYDFEEEMRSITTPFLIMTGDEDEGAIEPSVMMKRAIPTAGLFVFPRSGHTINIEEPTLFNMVVSDFITRSEAGAWGERDPRSLSASTTGMGD